MIFILFGIHWTLTYSWVIPLLLLILFVYCYRYYKLQVAVHQIAGKWKKLIVHNFSSHIYYIKMALFSAGLFFLAVALLRPQWHQQDIIINQEGRDVLIALDISRSMLATDFQPNRLEVAKKKIKQLLSLLACERVGLILFSGSAFIQCPLTTDYQAFYMFLNHVDVETISSGSTALDAALQQALRVFKSAQDRKSKLLVVFTDGEDFSSNLAQLKDEAKKQNIRIFTIGVGTSQGAPIPLFDEQAKQVGHQKDSKGRVVISQLNEGILQNLATDLGGAYISITEDTSDLTRLVTYITSFEKERFEDKKLFQFEDKYHYFLLISLCCFLGEWIL